MSKYICVFIKSAALWRAKGHTHWFVCKSCLNRIRTSQPVWIEDKEKPPEAKPLGLKYNGYAKPAKTGIKWKTNPKDREVEVACKNQTDW